MSTVINRIATIWEGRDYITPMMRTIRGEIRNLRGDIDRTSRSAGQLDMMMRALQTTMRYAFSGGIVFGAMGQIRQLSEIQKQLGLISAIGEVSTGGRSGVALIGNDLRSLGDDARQAAVDAIQPIGNINDAIVNLLSTVQNVPENQITPIVEDIAKAATLAQTPAEDLTKAVTTMNIAFQRTNNLRNIHGMNEAFFALTRLAPGGVSAGREIIQQLGPLAAVTAQGKGTPQQMLSLALASTQFGGTPANAMRGLQYLIQSITTPTTPGAAKALAGIGITPETVANEGVYPNLMKLFGALRTMGVSPDRQQLGQLQGMDDQTLSDLEATMGPAAVERLPGGFSGQAATFLRQAIGRIHGIRAAIVLASQMDPGPGGRMSLDQDLKVMNDAINGHITGVHGLRQAWDRYNTQARLAQAATAVNTLAQDLLQPFAPALNLGARGVVGLERRIHSQNEIVAYGGMGAILAAILGRRALGGRFGRGGGLGGLLRRGAGVGVGVGALADEFDPARQNQIGGSPTNPMYVVVVGQIFGPRGTGPGGLPIPGPQTGPRGIPTQDLRTVASEVGVETAASRAARRGARAASMGRAGLWRAAEIGAAYLAIDQTAAMIPGLNRVRNRYSGSQGWGNLGGDIASAFSHPFRHRGPTQGEAADIQAWAFRHDMNAGARIAANNTLEQLQQAYPNGNFTAAPHVVQVQGQSEIVVDITQKDDSGKVIGTKRVHVTQELFPKFGPPKAPSLQGKDKAQKGGK